MPFDEELQTPQPVRGFYLSEFMIGLAIVCIWSSILVGAWRFNPVDATAVAALGLLTAFIKLRFFVTRRRLADRRRRELFAALTLGTLGWTYAGLIFDNVTRTQHGATTVVFSDVNLSDQFRTDGLSALDAHLKSLGFELNNESTSARRYKGSHDYSDQFQIEVRFDRMYVITVNCEFRFSGFRRDVARNETKASQFNHKLADWWKKYSSDWRKSYKIIGH